MIIPRYYEDLHMLHENTMPDRCYYIPASERMDCLVEERERSDRIQMLNGTWKFRFYDSIYDLKDLFYETGYDTEQMEEVQVPGLWQYYGYDTHQYTNLRYPFPADPPYVPQDNPCAAYICDFEYSGTERAPRVYLEFEGVDSCFYVWLNGDYVGYSQVSHALSEFDVTDRILEGSNRLAVLVLKWCDGSYLEDQDKFRMSGIFRDVYLMKRPQQCIYDYFIHTGFDENKAKISIETKYLDRAVPVKMTVYDEEGKKIAGFVYEGDTSFEIQNPKLWNSEEPYLYTVILETEAETIVERVGIREIHVEGNVVLVNGRPVKFRGVNRHDSDPFTGSVISMDQMKKDLELIKKHNFNAIRSSHYPNQPMFYQMCDQYGFFVIDEADNESHGAWMQCYPVDTYEERASRWNELISDNPEFDDATLDRVKKLVLRDKNRPCVLIWSMGNECGYGCTIEKALAWTRAFDPDRLTHFESAFYKGRKRKYDYSNLNLYSRMYPGLDEVQEYVRSGPDKPFIMCEYSHSMGNGAGDYEDYFELIDRNDCVCGGFIWEWCDHAVYKGKTEEGKAIFYYGGDHHEYPHDTNFCVDGLVYPDRTPHTGLLECKNVNRPARLISYDQEMGEVLLRNMMNYVDLKEYLSVYYELSADGHVLDSGRIEEEDIPDIAPGCTGSLPVSLSIPEKGRVYLKLFYYLKHTDPLREEGSLLGFDELLLKNEGLGNRTVLNWKEESKNKSRLLPAIRVSETERELIAQGEHFRYTYSKLRGMFTGITVQGKELLDRPMELNVWRAPTDNDMYIRTEWQKAMYDRAVSRAYSTHYTMTDEHIEIYSSMSMTAVTVQRMMSIDTIWRIDNAGQISVKMDVVRNLDFPELPRFGLRMFLPASLDEVTYFGLGPEESYIDKRRASSHGEYSAHVVDLHEDYIRPQENGSHADCDFVSISGDGMKVNAFSDQTFSFNASVYTQEELTEKMHNYELSPCGSTVLNLDLRQNGIGSNSCGPRLQEKYRFIDECFTYTMSIQFEGKQE